MLNLNELMNDLKNLNSRVEFESKGVKSVGSECNGFELMIGWTL